MDPHFFPLCNTGLESLYNLTHPCSINQTIQFEDGSTIEVGDTIADPKPTIEEQMILEDMRGEVRAFVEGLSPYLQCVVIRRFWMNHSPQKIADDLGRRRPAIYDALARVARLGKRDLAPVLAQ